jgi:hypothetical protein
LDKCFDNRFTADFISGLAFSRDATLIGGFASNFVTGLATVLSATFDVVG